MEKRSLFSAEATPMSALVCPLWPAALSHWAKGKLCDTKHLNIYLYSWYQVYFAPPKDLGEHASSSVKPAFLLYVLPCKSWLRVHRVKLNLLSKNAWHWSLVVHSKEITFNHLWHFYQVYPFTASCTIQLTLEFSQICHCAPFPAHHRQTDRQ